MKIAKAIAADVYLNDGEDFHTAGIDIFYAKDKPDETGFISPHGNAIECYGDGEDAARYLRDRVLLCMTMHDELVAALRELLAEYESEIKSEWSGTSSLNKMLAKADPARAVLAKVEGH